MMNTLVMPVRDLLDRVRTRPSVRARLQHWVYGPEFREWSRSHDCAARPTREEMYRHLLRREALDGPIDYLEFGVSRGDSIRWWVENNRHPESSFIGFDSFEGLPEEWAGQPAGAFSTDGQVPLIDDARCHFVKGLFQESLPGWLDGREFPRRTVVHLDADLYTSTLVVLTQCLPRLNAGSILIFDEFHDPLHEYRAFRDAMAAYRRSFLPLCRADGWTHAAFQIVEGT
jgi:hypothetical protein